MATGKTSITEVKLCNVICSRTERALAPTGKMCILEMHPLRDNKSTVLFHILI